MDTNTDSLLIQARQALQSGHPQEAESACRAVLARTPGDGRAHHLMGLALAIGGHPAQALPSLEQAARLQPGDAETLFDLAHAQQDTGDLEAAAASYRKAMQLAPSWPAPWANLGGALIGLGKHNEAIDLLYRGQRLFPRDADLADTLGTALLRENHYREALDAYRQAALNAPDNPAIQHNLALALHLAGDAQAALAVAAEAVQAHPGHAGLKALLGGTLLPQCRDPQRAALMATALAEGWGDAAALSSAAWTLLDAIPGIGGRGAPDFLNWPANEPPAWLLDLARHPLLSAVLRHGLVNHPQWEIRLTHLRRALLDGARLSLPLHPGLTGLVEALAEQCFYNEYVFAQSGEEEQKLAALAQALSASPLPLERRLDALLVYACYRPLATLPAPALAGMEQSAGIAPLYRQQIAEPQEESRIARALPSLTPIDAGLSSQVRQQYEENPYPRWKSVPLMVLPATPNQAMTALFPACAPFRLPDAPNILIAGTGTGLNAILTARRFPRANILAIDLSRASLAYAARRARELGHDNIRFAQADILRLAEWKERFHVIESVGVLHHMDDVLHAWRILNGLLEPDGVMKIGLYSRLGRTDLTPLQDAIAARKLAGTPEDIRALRAQVLAGDAPPGWSTVATRHDFYTLSACRDLLFHVHEQALELDDLSRMIEQLGLQFLGFELTDSTTLQNYRKTYPRDRGMNDLKLWKQWEEAHPAQFSGMYQFWARRSGQHTR